MLLQVWGQLLLLRGQGLGVLLEGWGQELLLQGQELLLCLGSLLLLPVLCTCSTTSSQSASYPWGALLLLSWGASRRLGWETP